MYELVLVLCLAKNECIMVSKMDMEAEECKKEMEYYNSSESHLRRAWVDGWAPGTTHLKQPAFCFGGNET